MRGDPLFVFASNTLILETDAAERRGVAAYSEEDWPIAVRYQIVWVARLPSVGPGSLERSEEDRTPACMQYGVPIDTRIGRQIIPRSHVQRCCWYHSVDWHRASAAAINVAREVPDAPRIAVQAQGDMSDDALQNRWWRPRPR
jgi:hypothetical protein